MRVRPVSARSAVVPAIALALALVPVIAAAVSSAGFQPTVIASSDGTATPTYLGLRSYPLAVTDMQFNTASGVSGQYAAIGSPRYNGQSGTTTNTGLVSVYRHKPTWEGWTNLGDLVSPRPIANQYFGKSVAVSGNEIFASLPAYPAVAETNYGALAVYEATTTGVFNLTQILRAPLFDGGGGFMAEAISVEGTTLVASGVQANVGAVVAGEVCVFSKDASGWAFAQRIVPPSPESMQFFGISLALSGDDLIVGSHMAGGGAGRIYFYRRQANGTWAWNTTVDPASPGPNDQFGWSVAICDGYALAAAPDREASGTAAAGAVFGYRWNGSTWGADSQGRITSPSYPHGGENFGYRIAMTNGTAFITAQGGPDYNGSGTVGAVYQYDVTSSGLSYVRRINAPGMSTSVAYFGSSLAFDGQTLLAGTPYYSVGVANGGAAWFWGGLHRNIVRGDKKLVLGVPGLLGNDLTNTGTMTASLETSPTHGTVLVGLDGSCTYTPTLGYSGPDSFTYRARTVDTSAVASVAITVTPAPVSPTSITIKTNATSARIGNVPILSGAVTPNTMIGKNIVVYVKKPGKTYWTYSSNRTVYLLSGHAAWQYKYYFKPGMVKGVYTYKAVVPAWPGFLTSTSPTTVTIRLR